MNENKRREEIADKYKRRLLDVIEKLKRREYDEEFAHRDADDIICELLKELGFGDVVEVYDKIPKWYA